MASQIHRYLSASRRAVLGIPKLVPRIRDFVQNVISELKKCTWPTREELKSSTVVVIVSMLILSVFVALADWVSQLVIRFITVTL